jgi:hypothetical protein
VTYNSDTILGIVVNLGIITRLAYQSRIFCFPWALLCQSTWPHPRNVCPEILHLEPLFFLFLPRMTKSNFNPDSSELCWVTQSQCFTIFWPLGKSNDDALIFNLTTSNLFSSVSYSGSQFSSHSQV